MIRQSFDGIPCPYSVEPYIHWVDNTTPDKRNLYSVVYLSCCDYLINAEWNYCPFCGRQIKDENFKR